MEGVTVKEEPVPTADDDCTSNPSQPVNNLGGDHLKMEVTNEEPPPKKKRVHKNRKPLTEEQRVKERERRRLKRAAMTPEERSRESQRTRRRFLEATPEQQEEMKAKKRFHMYVQRLQMTDEERKAYNLRKWIGKQARIAEMTEEEKEEARRKNVENFRNYYKNLEGERLEKHKELMRVCARRQWKSRPDKMLENLRKRTAKETPEQRKKRLRGYKINQRRRKMKKEMENEGIWSKEEIESRLVEWTKEERARPLSPVREEEISEYKPRYSGRKPKRNGRRWKEIYEGKPRSPPPPRKGQRHRRTCWKLPKLPLQQEEILVPKSPPPLLPPHGGDVHLKKNNVEPPPPSHQICILNPLPAHLIPEQEEEHEPPSPATSFGGDFPDPESPSSPPPPENIQDYPEKTPIPHIQEHQPPPPLPIAVSSEITWKCPLCPTPIPSLSSLPHHLLLHHPLHPSTPNTIPSPPTSSLFQCILCPWGSTSSPPPSLQFKKSSHLLHHVYLHHPTSYYPCPCCSLLYYSSSRLSLHLLSCKKSIPSRKPPTPKYKPPQSLRICEDCGRTLKNIRCYNLHQQNCHPDKTQNAPLICQKCQRTCINLRTFWLHFAQCGLKIPRRNFIPPKSSQLPRKPRRTDCRYSNDGPFICFQCSKTFVQKATLDDHIRRDHEGKTHQCPICNKNFQSAGKVWRHQVEYHGLNPKDLPAPPRGGEVTNCKYCDLLVMRGYEQHVKKNHPGDLEDFRENVLPEWKHKVEIGKQIKEMEAGGGGGSRQRSGGGVREGARPKSKAGGDNGKIACSYCPAVLPERSLRRHVMNKHEAAGEWRCEDCQKVFRNQGKLEVHVAQVHAYREIEEVLEEKQLICDKKMVGEGRKQVTCKLCGLEVPLDKYSVRVHFVVSHYDEVFRFFDEYGKKRDEKN